MLFFSSTPTFLVAHVPPGVFTCRATLAEVLGRLALGCHDRQFSHNHTVLMLAPRFLRVLLFLVFGILLFPPTAQAQFGSFNFCSIFEQFPSTAGVESALFESWNETATDWDANERWILSYQNENPIQFRFQERTPSGTWADSSRSLASYDGADRLTECAFQFVEASGFVNAVRTLLTYNTDGLLDVEIAQTWDSTNANPNGVWVNSQRTTFTYDNSGNVTQEVDDFWDSNAQAWMSSTRIQNSYDASNRLTTTLTEQSDGSGGWINDERTQNTYGPDGLTETLEEEWDFIFQNWQNVQRTLFSYPAPDTEVEVVQLWTGAGWENEERSTAQFNANGFPESDLFEIWTGSSWVNADRTLNSYTTVQGTQKLEQILDQTWDSNPGAWVNDSRSTFSYSGVIPVELASFEAWTTGTRAQLRWQTASETGNAGFDVHHRPGSESTWRTLGFVESNVPGGTTSDPQSYRFQTDALTLGTHDFRLRQVDLDGTTTLTDPVSVTVGMKQPLRLTAPSPHPVSGRSTFSFALNQETDAEVALYNLLGQRVRILHRGPVPANRDHSVTLDTQGLASGQYILRLRAGGYARSLPITVIR